MSKSKKSKTQKNHNKEIKIGMFYKGNRQFWKCAKCGKEFQDSITLYCDDGIICPFCDHINDKGYNLTNAD